MEDKQWNFNKSEISKTKNKNDENATTMACLPSKHISHAVSVILEVTMISLALVVRFF